MHMVNFQTIILTAPHYTTCYPDNFDINWQFLSCRGFHLAVIHSEIDLLDKLLFIMSRDNRLRTVIDEQNNLYQVRGRRERERGRGEEW